MTDAETFEWNKYIIRKHSIGKGSFSKVYYGYHKETKVEIALKKILFRSLQNSIKDKVISEIHILQKMNHANIMKLYEYKFDGDYIFLVTEYCNEKDIGHWMKSDHTASETAAIMIQITRGIQYMHQNHILHRDIKPENILIHNGIIKICDFGFSTIIKEQQQMLQTICGTPLFMSPELLFLKPYTMKSDVWSLGVLFYMMCYRLHPFGIIDSVDDYRIKIKRSVIYTTIEEIAYLITIMEQMLSYDADKRPDVDMILKSMEEKSACIVLHNDIITPVSTEDLSRNQLLQRINELEYEIFELEEQCEKTNSCCFGKSGPTDPIDKSPAVTGRGRTNSGYELSITQDYFTPPEIHLGAVHIPARHMPSRSFSRSNSNSSGSFLSTSLEKLSAFFSFGKK
jgi:serine/threonine-protein kinase ULK/ATG1